jgi:uncharacterized protein YbgA (DUF1722 family)/uncharacterized protein YbbK (DUF523 family)
MTSQTPSIRVGISSCLLGHAVRFDGNHKHQRFITDDLGRLFEYVPVCPEMAIGMGVPRKPIRLVDDIHNPRARGVSDMHLDVTEPLINFAKTKAASLGDISGYILKKGSPSCGMERVRIYGGNGLLSNQGVGLYAKELMRANPLLPVEEEGRLLDTGLRENFVQRVMVYHRWQQLMASGLSAAKLVDFHTRHKFLLLAHDEATYRALGRLIAQLGDGDLSDIAEQYITALSQGLKKPSSRLRHSNVLYHFMGYLKAKLTSSDKQELRGIIDDYRKGDLPRDVPLVLLRHHFRHHPSRYIQNQFYLFGALTMA